MPQFNSQSAARIPAGTGSLLTSVSGFVGAYPILKASTAYEGVNVAVTTTLSSFRSAVNIVSGFIGDGDGIELPNGSTGSLGYFDNAGNASTDGAWSGGILHTDINAAADQWVGFMFDKTDDLLYCCVSDSGVNPHVFYFASITQLGVIDNIGNDPIDVDFPGGVPAKWSTSQTAAAASFYRQEDGSGNFIIRFNDGGERTFEAQFSSSDGSLQVNNSVISGSFSYYKTLKGNYAGLFSVANDQSFVDIFINGDKDSLSIGVPTETNAPSGSSGGGVMPLQWKGEIAFCSGTVSNISAGVKAVSVVDLNNFIDILAVASGASS